MPLLADAHPALESRKAEGQERILDDLEIAGYGRPRHLGIAGQSRHIQGLAVKERSDGQEAGEPGRFRTSASAWTSSFRYICT